MARRQASRPASVTLLIMLLGFLALGSLYGGVTLVLDPSGDLLGLPLSVFNHATSLYQA